MGARLWRYQVGPRCLITHSPPPASCLRATLKCSNPTFPLPAFCHRPPSDVGRFIVAFGGSL